MREHTEDIGKGPPRENVCVPIQLRDLLEDKGSGPSVIALGIRAAAHVVLSHVKWLAGGTRDLRSVLHVVREAVWSPRWWRPMLGRCAGTLRIRRIHVSAHEIEVDLAFIRSRDEVCDRHTCRVRNREGHRPRDNTPATLSSCIVAGPPTRSDGWTSFSALELALKSDMYGSGKDTV